MYRLSFPQLPKEACWEAVGVSTERDRSWINGFGRGSPPPATFSTDLKSLMERWEIKSGIKAERLELIDVRGEVGWKTEGGRHSPMLGVEGPVIEWFVPISF